MINALPSVQLTLTDLLANQQSGTLVQIGGTSSISCPNGVLTQDVVLAPDTSSLALAFPAGVTTALVVLIAALNIQDLAVNVFGSPMQVPPNQGVILYNLSSSQVSLSSTNGGQVQYVVGG